MSENSSREVVLKKRLQEVENVLDALRNHKVDAVVGSDQVALLRLKEVEDQLHEQIKISENRLEEIESIYRNVPVGLCVLDQDLKFVRVNNHLANIHGIPAEQHMGRTMSELLPRLAGDIEKDLREIIETGVPKMNVELSGETPARPGETRFLLEHWLPLHDRQGKVDGINMVINEVTERKQYEKKLEEQVNERTKIAEQRADKLREMALKMTHIEEKERQRLANVLHDGLQQLLVGAKFNTSMIRQKLNDDQDDIKDEVEQLVEILDQSIEASRSLSYELSPPILQEQGLIPALNWLADMRNMQALAIDIHSEGQIPELSHDLKSFLFQAVRELLLNIIKHAEVDKAKIWICSEGEFLNIKVSDQGKGFDVEVAASNASNSRGLRNIREKLELMNGELKISSQPGEGSTFTIRVPADYHSP